MRVTPFPAIARRWRIFAALILAGACAALAASQCQGGRSKASGSGRGSQFRVGNVDVSQAPGPQAEVRVAVDPRQPSRLLAASNSDQDPGMRVYSSSDGGRSWLSA